MKNVIETAGWKALSWGAACAIGTLTFLKLVANEIERARYDLESIDQTERKLAEQRLEAEQEMMVVEATKPGKSGFSTNH